MRNYLSIAIRNERNAYINQQIKINASNPRKLWNDFSAWNIHVKPKSEISEEIKDPTIINDFFTNKACGMNINPDTLNYYQQNIHENYEENVLDPITPEKIEDILKKMKSNAFGVDGINLKMLKYVMPFCKEALVHIINTSLDTGVVPSIWKRGLITPVPKISVANELNDLRPINVLPAMSKIIEVHISDYLNQHITNNKLLPSIQSGFRSCHSTNTAMIKITNDLTRAIDNSQVTYLVLLDFSSAFDVINHDLLIQKLKYYKVNERLLNWLKHYLSERSQIVKLDIGLSEENRVLSGVPQGSVLGPLLFIIFTADLHNIITNNWNIHLYADDTQLYKSCDPELNNVVLNELCNVLSSVSLWSSNNGLVLNPTKTKLMCIGSKHLVSKANESVNTDVVLNDTIVNMCDSAKNLGIIMDTYLNFEKHVTKKLSISYAKFKSLWRYKHVLSPVTKWNLTNSLILSNMEFGCCVYYNFLSNEFKNKIQKLQNSCLRYSFTNINRTEHITPHYNKQNLLKIESKFLFMYASLLYNIVKNSLPEYLVDLLTSRTDVHNINLRNIESRYTIPQHNCAKFENSFEYFAPKLLNEYPEYFALPSIHKFRKEFKSVVLHNQIHNYL